MSNSLTSQSDMRDLCKRSVQFLQAAILSHSTGIPTKSLNFNTYTNKYSSDNKNRSSATSWTFLIIFLKYS